MPNHFHLLLQQITDEGISKYLHRLQTGYTMYFNKRYERSGALFQSTFKCKQIKDDSYLLQLSRYIHLNPIKILSPDCNDAEAVNRLLLRYEWSSYREFCQPDHALIAGVKNIILDLTGGAEGYHRFVADYVNKGRLLSRLSLDKHLREKMA
jgi:putative transposase